MYKNTVTHYIAKTLVDILFYTGIVAVAAVPWWSKWIRDFLLYSPVQWYIMMAVLMLSGICTVYVLFILKGMFKTLLGGNPFVLKNVSAFRKIAVACALIALIYMIKCFFLFSLATLVIVFIFIIGTLFCLTLKDIFKQAVYYKEEHDWTV